MVSSIVSAIVSHLEKKSSEKKEGREAPLFDGSRKHDVFRKVSHQPEPLWYHISQRLQELFSGKHLMHVPEMWLHVWMHVWVGM